MVIITVIRADTQVRPYVDPNEMKVLRHVNECSASDIRKFVGQFAIPFANHEPFIIEPHL